jgi:acetoin utilization deacetylase AcuC-like enzyme
VVFSDEKENTMTICIRCKNEKEQNEFIKNSRAKSGFSTLCKQCYNKEKREYLDKNRERVRGNNLRWYYKYHEEIKKQRRIKTVKYREINREKINQYQKQYWIRNAKELRKKQNEYSKKPERLIKQREYTKRYRLKKSFKYKDKARGAFERAVKYGFIIRPDKCSRCGIKCKPDGHHTDYAKPLEVQWLCKICHNQAHGKLLDINPI